MKVLFAITILSIACSIKGKAQINDQFRNKLWEEYKNKKLNTDIFRLDRKKDSALRLSPEAEKSQKPEQPDVSVITIPIKGKYIGSNGKGDEVFAMEPDNMPCLVPGKTFKAAMPVVGNGKSQNLPLP